MPVEFKDYYAILGVPRDATENDIKKAFRSLARRYHPDVAGGDKASEEKFKEVNEAYEVLGDPVKRRKYDQLGAHWQDYEAADSARAYPGGGRSRFRRDAGGSRRHQFHFGGTTGFSDFFEQFFGPRGDFGEWDGWFGDEFPGANAQAGAATAGRDTEADLMVRLEETLRGAERVLRLEQSDPVSGRTAVHAIRVRIPAGVRDGQRLRIPGRGEAAVGGGPAGDLYLRVRLAAHPDFRVRGADLYHDLTLAPWEAVLGTTIDVKTPGNQNARVRIPPGTRSGRHLRLRGHGLPRREGGRGDLYVVINIDVPGRVTADERALWEKLRRASSFAPRRPR